MRLGLQVRLNANHYDLVCADDGLTNISEAVKHMPDLMILDLGLPARASFSVLERMKQTRSQLHFRQDRVANRDRAIRAGAKTFLQKPIEHGKRLAVSRLIVGAKDQPPALIYDLSGAGPFD